METTMISNEAYAKIVNLIKTFYLQGFEDAANCPEPVDMSEDIEKQLDILGIYKQKYDCNYCKAPEGSIERGTIADYCNCECDPEFFYGSDVYSAK